MLTETPHGLLDLTVVAVDLTELVESIPKVDNSLTGSDFVEALDAYDAALVEAARREYPQYEWHLEEPRHDTVLIDREGVIWTYVNAEPDDDFSEPEWTPHCWSIMHKLMTTGPIGNEWSDVLVEGPVRTHVPEVDGPAVRRWRYRPGGANANADQTEYLCDSVPATFWDADDE